MRLKMEPGQPIGRDQTGRGQAPDQDRASRSDKIGDGAGIGARPRTRMEEIEASSDGGLHGDLSGDRSLDGKVD
jgi:hypothetical protein